MMNKLIAASVVAVLGHVATASAGVPGWCKDASFEANYNLSDLSSTDVERVVTTLAKATCKPTPEAEAAKAQIETARQAWGKKLLMNDADWADAVSFANVDTRPAPLAFSVKDVASMTPLDQYLMINTTLKVGQHGDFDDADYLADMFEPNLSEVGRFAYIERCVKYTSVSDVPAAEYAECQADIDAFDKTRFASDLRSDTGHPGANKMEIRLRLYAFPEKLKEHADAVKQILAQDAGYKQLWDAAARGRAQWAASTLAQDKDLLALAARLDSATWFKSRKQFEGCEATTEAALAKVIASKVPASTFKDAGKDIPKARDDYEAHRDVTSVASRIGPMLSDIPELMFVLGPYVECHDPSKDSRSEFFQTLFTFSPGYRGPRRAALTAITKAKVVLDDVTAKVSYPQAGMPFEWGGYLYSSGGVVKSVKDEGDHIVVSLEKLLVKREECVESHATTKITRINSDGSLSYELICDRMGTVVYDDTPADFDLDTIYKPLLKKGVQFTAVGRAVLAIWADKDAKLPNNVLGTAVK